jgi:hypothetical protein
VELPEAIDGRHARKFYLVPAFIIGPVRRMLAATLVAAAAAAMAAGASAHNGECEAAGRVCLGTLPSSHAHVVLNSQNGSSERGVARITLGFHETQVVFRLKGAPAGIRQAVNVLKGGCGGKLLVRLGSIVGGKGIARGNPIEHLSGYAIVVHETTAGGARIVACGVVPNYVPRRR